MTNLRQSVLKRLNRNLQGKMALVKHEGCSFLLDTRNSLDMKLMGGMNWERSLRDRAVAEITRDKIDLFIDVGANLGLYTIDLNRRTALKETVAFEPLPSNFNQLCGNIFMNNMGDRVTAERTALSDQDGAATLHIDSQYTIHSTLETHGENSQKFDTSINVPLARFDTRYPYENRRAFVKMDIEGHETSALKGMAGFLARNKASLQIEASDVNLPGIAAFLSGLGYGGTGRRGYDHFFSNIQS